MKTNEPQRASLTIRNIPKAVKEGLRVQAALHGHSMEAEARQVLSEAVKKKPAVAAKISGAKVTKSKPVTESGKDFYERIHRRFAAIGGVNLPPHPPVVIEEPMTFD